MDNYAYQPDNHARKPYTISRPQLSPDVIGSSTNYLVEVNSRQTLFKKQKFFKRLSIVCLVLLFLLLIIIIVLLLLYISEHNRIGICTSDQCLRSAANLKYSMDLTVDPCDNFYDYTCGHWSREHPNHGWFPQFSTFDEIGEKISIITRDFLTSEPQEDDPLPVTQARMLYESCMDTDALDKLGYSTVFKYLNEVGLPETPSYFTKSKEEHENFEFDWLKMEPRIKKIFAMDVFIGFLVDTDRKNISRNVIYVGTPGLECPLPSPLKGSRIKKYFKSHNNDSSEDVLEALKEYTEKNIMKYVLTSLIFNSTQKVPEEDVLKSAVDILYNITYELRELARNFTAEDYFGIPRSVDYLQQKTDEFLSNDNIKKYPNLWENYLNNLFRDTNVTLDLKDTDRLYIDETEEPYLPAVISYLMSKEKIHLELYMWWVTVLAMIMNTTTSMAEYIKKQVAPFYPEPAVRSRSHDCTHLVTSFMSYAVSYGVFDRNFPNTTKPKVEQMVADIKDAFVQRVQRIEWMDKETKQATFEKTKNMMSFIGYPDWLFQNGSLEKYYEDLVIQPDTYLDNLMGFVKEILPAILESLRKENERTWKTDPTSVNAFNSFDTNAINIPIAILSFPVYDLGLQSLQYGAIGMVLGHELTHGFDNDGRKYDKYGNRREWWSNDTSETFETKTKCFIKQYDNFTLEGVEGHVNGKDTLGENIADNGGLQEAYVAYQNYLRRNGPEPLLPGFENFTSVQLFFIAFASIWCESANPEVLKTQLTIDEHAPNSVRVLATLQNSGEFAEAFKCPLGSNMNPTNKKCSIW